MFVGSKQIWTTQHATGTLLNALRLMAIYSIRSERRLAVPIDTNLMFWWFLDMNPEEEVFDAMVLTNHRPRTEQPGIISTIY